MDIEEAIKQNTISIEEAAKLKGVSRQSIINAIKRGTIQVLADRKLLRRSDVDAYKPKGKPDTSS